MDLSDFLKLLLGAIAVGVTGFAAWAVTNIFGMVKVAFARAALDHAVINATRGVEQSMGHLRVNGKLSDADADRMTQAAMSGARQYLGGPGRKNLMETFDWDEPVLDDTIKMRIKAALFEVKNGVPPAPSAPTMTAAVPPVSIPPGSGITK